MRHSLLLSFTAILALPVFHANAKVEVLLSGGHGKADPAVVTEPFSVDFDSTGTPWGVEFVNGNRVFKINPQGKLEFIAGQFWTYSEKGTVVAPAEGKAPMEIVFRGMHDIAINAQDEAFIADSFGHKIRKMNLKTHEVTTIAGSDTPGFAGDGGPSINAKFNTTICGYLSADQKTLFVADIGNARIRALDLVKGTITTVAGGGKKGGVFDGSKATEVHLSGPRACCVSKDGTLYIVQREGNSLAAVKNGIINMVVNTTNQKGYAGDGGPAKEAKLNGPKYVCMDPQDRVHRAPGRGITEQGLEFLPLEDPLDGSQPVGTLGMAFPHLMLEGNRMGDEQGAQGCLLQGRRPNVCQSGRGVHQSAGAIGLGPRAELRQDCGIAATGSGHCRGRLAASRTLW